MKGVNRLAKTVLLDADKARNLRFSSNQLIELEEQLGRSVMSLDEGLRFADLRTMIHVGLRWEDKDLTLEQTGEIMDVVIEKHGFEELSKKVGEAVKKAFGGKAQPPSQK
jgi:hypothetical protein